MKHLLFLCSKNKLRSPTAEFVFADYPGIEVDSAGISNVADMKSKITRTQALKIRHRRFVNGRLPVAVFVGDDKLSSAGVVARLTRGNARVQNLFLSLKNVGPLFREVHADPEFAPYPPGPKAFQDPRHDRAASVGVRNSGPESPIEAAASPAGHAHQSKLHGGPTVAPDRSAKRQSQHAAMILRPYFAQPNLLHIRASRPKSRRAPSPLPDAEVPRSSPSPPSGRSLSALIPSALVNFPSQLRYEPRSPNRHRGIADSHLHRARSRNAAATFPCRRASVTRFPPAPPETPG